MRISGCTLGWVLHKKRTETHLPGKIKFIHVSTEKEERLAREAAEAGNKPERKVQNGFLENINFKIYVCT